MTLLDNWLADELADELTDDADAEPEPTGVEEPETSG